MSNNYRNLCIETLADDNAMLREQLAQLTCDFQTWRELAQRAIHALAGFHERERSRQERYERLLHEARQLRAEIIQRAA